MLATLARQRRCAGSRARVLKAPPGWPRNPRGWKPRKPRRPRLHDGRSAASPTTHREITGGRAACSSASVRDSGNRRAPSTAAAGALATWSRPSISKMIRAATLALLAVGASGFVAPATPRQATALAASGSQIAYRIRSVALRPTTNDGCGCLFNETSLFAAAESRHPTSTHALCTTGESASPTRTRAGCA